MANNHYVPRLLTTPWEVTYKKRSRQLLYYDFADRRIHHEASRYLLAAPGLYDDATEQAFNRYIETPLSRFRELLRLGTTDFSDWRVIRAVCLQLVLQAYRLPDSAGWSKDIPVVDLLASEDALDSLAKLYYSRVEFRFSRIRVGYLYFPEGGTFAMPVLDTETGDAMAMVLPLLPNLAVVALPRTIKTFDGDRFSGPMMGIFSVGFDSTKTRRVVLPPHFVAMGAKEVRDEVEATRRKAEKIVELCLRLRSTIEDDRLQQGLPLVRPKRAGS